MYLNTIYYGNSAYGIEAAAITYFNKDASDLTLNEAATLAGLPNSPSYYDPTVNMDACVERRNHVLDRMLSMGDITQEEYDENGFRANYA
uniref:peptidoglycan glycosyltransferase n=1 Tax=uncultured Olsenella sp. TaxID=190764 RepID=A0A060C2J4_9ACTN|nr:Transgly [uncultured Olsenella sp.]